jgi:DNA-binding beta-propeller fold protein YncE
VLVACVTLSTHAALFGGKDKSAYLSPLALAASADGKALYVAESTADQVAVYDLATSKVASVIDLDVDGELTGLALSPDGKTLAVTVAGPKGEIVLQPVDGGKGTMLTYGHTPVAPVFSPAGDVLYVCSRFTNELVAINVKNGKVLRKTKMSREPFATALLPDGSKIFVANHLPAGSANGEYTGSAIDVVDTKTGKKIASIALPNGSTGLRGACVSPDGKYVYVTHILARYQLPTTQLERGWMNTNALSVVDTATNKLVNTVLLDDVDLGAANPWGVACTADGSKICVATAGTHEIAVIDAKGLHERLDKAAKNEKVTEVTKSADDVPNDLSFLVGIKDRRKLAGNGPRGIAIVGDTVYASEYFTDSLGVVKLGKDVIHRPKSLPLGPKVEMSQERTGERYFNDADFCFQKWQSCASCHPDARADGLNWDLLNDGMGNPKQTKSMLLSHKTPPVMVTGIRGDAETAVRAGLKYIQFAVRPEEDAVAIDKYLESLEPVPSPFLEDGKLSKSAKRGEKIFKKAGCAECHPAPLYTDLKSYDVGLGVGRHKDTKFDTPTLVENWRSGPYLYDGRAATMKDVLKACNPNDTHGKTSDLSAKELEDLATFILSQ